ncbi:MAG: GHKL domain-containing protein [Clostridiales bacterium]|nr:GHKL domain-containing protein [Clostridiales bacterium]
MSISMKIVTILSLFVLAGTIDLLLLPPIRKKTKLILYAYLFTTACFGSNFFGYVTAGVMLTGALLILFYSHERFFIWNMILVLVSWLWSVLIDYGVSILERCMGYDYAMIYASNWLPWLHFTMTALFSLFPAYILGRTLRQKLATNPGLIPDRQLKALLLETILCAGIFVCYIYWGSFSGFSTAALIFNGILFLCFILVNLFLYMNLYQLLKENQELALRNQAQESLREYTTQLESHYQEMRRFRHDYMNILATLGGYINNGDLDRLKVFFDEKIMKAGNSLVDKNAVIGRLSQIEVLEIKGIFYTKCIEAMNRQIDVSLELTETIRQIPTDLLALSRILGIYLDNAIEAAENSAEKFLLLAVYTKNHQIIFHIENSTPPLSVPLEQLYQQGFSTKNGHNGLGLTNARLLLEQHPDIHVITEQKDTRFIQTIAVQKGD